VHSVDGLIAFAVIYGFFGGGVQSLFPAALSSLTKDLSKAGVRIGMVFSIVGIASLIGPPIAGALIQKREGGYLYAQLFGGVSMMLGAGLVLCASLVVKRS
jgi:MFS family permease